MAVPIVCAQRTGKDDNGSRAALPVGHALRIGAVRARVVFACAPSALQ